jgi:hypothetical protein
MANNTRTCHGLGQRLPYRSDDVRRATAATNSSARARNRFNSGEVFERL